MYLLLTGISHVFVGLEQRSDVDSLAPPDLSLDSPVKGQLQRPPIERPRTGQYG